MSRCSCSSHPCARCCWQSDPEDGLGKRLQLLAHAEEAEHPLCVVCSRSLALTERQSCERCLTASRELLAGVSLMYDELPEHVGHVRGARYDADAPAAADGRPLPGGVVLVLMGKGSAGFDDDGTTVKPGDPSSVAFDLAFWANIWAQARGEGPAVDDQVSARRQVRDAVAYLDTMTRWAGQQHSGFSLYVEDLRLLHGRLERATGRGDREERAEAECFQCGADALVRKMTDRGLEDHWTCARCGATYDWRRYVRAVAARVEDGRDHLRGVGWGTVRQVAAATGSSVATVRKWAQRGLVATCCLVESQEQLVWFPDADARAERNRRGIERRTG